MHSGWWYRAASAIGTTGLAAVATVWSLYARRTPGYGPPIDPTALDAPDAAAIVVATSGAALVIGLALEPMYRPRPRRVTSLLATTLGRLTLACLLLWPLGSGYGPLSLPAGALVPVWGILAVSLPPYYWLLRRRERPNRVLVVGDDRAVIEAVTDDLAVNPIGFVSPPTGVDAGRTGATERDAPGGSPARRERVAEVPTATDGGRAGVGVVANPNPAERLGGLSRLESLVRRHDVDTLALAFPEPDRGECFGSLAVAFDHGLAVVSHESLADDVLIAGDAGGSLVEVTVDPWPWYTHVSKRAFDVAFATVGLLVLAPVALALAATLARESNGSILYQQTRTAAFGGRIRVRKFRTMRPESENPVPQADRETEGITPVGRVLRRTHLDEIPQLWSVLRGDMSVVGPRANWIDEERLIEAAVPGWRVRWHVKPGLTGLAQVNDVGSTTGPRKLELDRQYIESQSFALDCRIVAAQLRFVGADVTDLLRRRLRRWLRGNSP
ncbi:sugar transferase [Halovivax limisalsi]|uniref:sugar transferase n=1 Tax=Halovivax limisalsi TaxID=1453760 RepID=UPI001FFD8C81|nr:sugar transferase [Halovivax limisalsi]